ncbi:MAG: PAS domain-containing protein, partial [Cyanobacteria bacterium P01_D01_bin.105]
MALLWLFAAAGVAQKDPFPQALSKSGHLGNLKGSAFEPDNPLSQGAWQSSERENFMKADCPIRDVSDYPADVPIPAIDPTDFYRAMWHNPVSSVFIVAVIDQGAEYEFVAFNPASARQSPIPVEQLQGKRISETFPPDAASRYSAHYTAAVRSGQVVTFEEDFTLPSGKSWWCVTLYPVKDQAGQVTHLIAAGNDITARRLAEATSEESRRVLQQVVDTIPAIIFWKDREGRYLGGNKRLAQVVDYGSVAEIVGKTDYDMSWSPEEAEGFVQDDRRVM